MTSAKEHKVFATSDLHLGHANIIKYCNRPFQTVEEMNQTLINNWNSVVSNNDTVYFLGDLAFGKGSKPTDHWISLLKGKIIFIKGNHDKSKTIQFHQSLIIEYKGQQFYLTHNPENIPSKWKHWAISGHHHNNKPQEFPFINHKTKTINISTEHTGYAPLDMDVIIKLIE